MRYKLLGRSGLRVSELCLGAMTFGDDWGWGAPKDECRKIFDAFAAAGGNFIDTANSYTNGTSETFVGEFMAANRERYVLATKYTLNRRPDDLNAGGNHRKNMVQALNASLKRLKTDYIDLYWVHAWDFTTPVDEVMRALDDMVRLGKILYIGISDTPAWIISQANTLADLKGWSRFVAMQVQYSLVERTPERDLLPMAQTFDIAVQPWSILGGGLLTGKYNPGKQRPSDARLSDEGWASSFMNERNFRIAAEVESIATELDRTPTQVAVNWVRQQQAAQLIPILGIRKLAQLEDNLAALEFTLSPEQLARLDAVSRIELGFPHEFLSQDRIKQIMLGQAFARLDNHRAGRPGQ